MGIFSFMDLIIVKTQLTANVGPGINERHSNSDWFVAVFNRFLHEVSSVRPSKGPYILVSRAYSLRYG